MATARTMSISASSADQGGKEVLGSFELAIGVGQALPQPLHGLSVVMLRHAYPPNILRHRGYLCSDTGPGQSTH